MTILNPNFLWFESSLRRLVWCTCTVSTVKMRTVQLILQFVCYRAFSAGTVSSTLQLSRRKVSTIHNAPENVCCISMARWKRRVFMRVWVHNACIMRGGARILCFIARRLHVLQRRKRAFRAEQPLSIPLSALHRITTEALVLKIVKHACAIFKLRVLLVIILYCTAGGRRYGEWMRPESAAEPCGIIHFVSQTKTFYHLWLS